LITQRTVRNRWIHSAGEMKNFSVLELVVHIVTTLLYRTKIRTIFMMLPIKLSQMVNIFICIRDKFDLNVAQGTEYIY
jgi:hypothetical protein